MHGYGMGGMWLWWLIPLLLVVLIYIAMSRKTENGSSRTGNDASRAEEILDERLARGDIDAETYEKLKEELKKGA